MVDTQYIKQLRLGINPPQPPGKTILLHHLPVIVRVAPALAGFREIIGRHPGHDRHIKLSIQLKPLGMRPHIYAIVSNKNRDIAKQLDATLVGIGFKLRPLLKKHVLGEFNQCQLFLVRSGKGLQSQHIM